MLNASRCNVDDQILVNEKTSGIQSYRMLFYCCIYLCMVCQLCKDNMFGEHTTILVFFLFLHNAYSTLCLFSVCWGMTGRVYMLELVYTTLCLCQVICYQLLIWASRKYTAQDTNVTISIYLKAPLRQFSPLLKPRQCVFVRNAKNIRARLCRSNNKNYFHRCSVICVYPSLLDGGFTKTGLYVWM